MDADQVVQRPEHAVRLLAVETSLASIEKILKAVLENQTQSSASLDTEPGINNPALGVSARVGGWLPTQAAPFISVAGDSPVSIGFYLATPSAAIGHSPSPLHGISAYPLFFNSQPAANRTATPAFSVMGGLSPVPGSLLMRFSRINLLTSRCFGYVTWTSCPSPSRVTPS